MRSGINIAVTASDKARLEAIIAGRSSPQKHVWRAQIILLSAQGLGTTAIMAATPEPKKFHRPSRDNRRFIGGHFHPNVAKQLRMLAGEDDTTVQALLEEALNLLMVKKGKGKIADLSS